MSLIIVCFAAQENQKAAFWSTETWSLILVVIVRMQSQHATGYQSLLLQVNNAYTEKLHFQVTEHDVFSFLGCTSFGSNARRTYALLVAHLKLLSSSSSLFFSWSLKLMTMSTRPIGPQLTPLLRWLDVRLRYRIDLRRQGRHWR